MLAATLRKVMSLMSERRRSRRRDLQLPARFVVLAQDGVTALVEPRQARVLNLSQRGCCLAVASLHLDQFHLNRCLESPEDYPLEVITQDPDGRCCRALGCVRWTNRETAATDLPFRVGLEWLAIGAANGSPAFPRPVKP